MSRAELWSGLAALAMVLGMLTVPNLIKGQREHEITMVKLKMGCPSDSK